MTTLLIPRNGFDILPRKPNSKHKHDIVVLGKNKYWFQREYKNSRYYVCSHPDCKFRITLRKDLSGLAYEHEYGYEDHVRDIAAKQHNPPHEDTWTEKNKQRQWSMRYLVSMCCNLQPREAWKSFNKLYPTMSLVFSKFKDIQSSLYRYTSHHTLPLPTTTANAVELMSNPDHIPHWNYWGRQKLQCDQMEADPDLRDLVVLKDVETIHIEIKQSEDAMRMHQKRSKYLHCKLLRMTAPEYYHSSFVWNTSPDGSIIVFGSHHGGLRLITPISTLFSCGTKSVISMRDGTFCTPQLAPSSSNRVPWTQVQQIGVLVQSPDMHRSSKFYDCMWALLRNKDTQTYNVLNDVIEEGFRKRGNADEWKQQTECIVNECCEYTQYQLDDGESKMQSEFPDESKDSSSNAMLNDSDEDVQIYAPNAIHVDFEHAPINTLRDRFKHIEIFGCFFHFFQANIKQIGKRGLKVTYLTNAEFRCAVIQLVLCAFLPAMEVPAEVDRLLHALRAVHVPGKKLAVHSFVEYFQKNWLLTYPPSVWNVFLRVDRTSNLLERDNRELKTAMGVKPFFWQYIDVLVNIDADATQDYNRLMKHGSRVFKSKKPKLRERDKDLWDVMQQYADSDDKDSKAYILRVASLFAKRTSDQAAVLQTLDEYRDSPITQIPFSINIEIHPHAHYVQDSQSLQLMRDDVCDAEKCKSAWNYIRSHTVWVSITNRRKSIPKAVYSEAIVYKDDINRLLNAIIGIKFGSSWRSLLVGYIEDDCILAFFNDPKVKYDIVTNISESIESGFVILL